MSRSTTSSFSWRRLLRNCTPYGIVQEYYRRDYERRKVVVPKAPHTPATPRPLPIEHLHEIFPGIQEVLVTLPARQIDRFAGMLPLSELLVLAAICGKVQPRRVFEFGTFRGASTLTLATSAAPDARVFTLDLPPRSRETRETKYEIGGEDILDRPYVSGEYFLNAPEASRITQLFGDSATFDSQPYQRSIDMVFIDASHSYENVLLDSRAAFNMLRPGGVIVWDDYHPQHGPGVIRALAELNNPAIAQIQNTRFAVYVERAAVSASTPSGGQR